MRALTPLLLTGALLCVCVGCGSSSSDSATTDRPATTGTNTASSGSATNDKGIGPITHVELGPVDEAVASQGKEVFETKCSACHKIEERYVGPALAGVTERRKPEWIMNMILNPDQMIKEDPHAQKLFTEYLTPMTFQNVTEDEAKAILTYFRSVDEGAEE